PLGWLTRSPSAAFRRGPRGPIHRVMDSPCLSAGGLRFWDHPVPTEGVSLPCRRLTGAGPTSIGLPRFGPAEARWGWVPSVLRGRGARAGARRGLLPPAGLDQGPRSLTRYCRLG